MGWLPQTGVDAIHDASPDESRNKANGTLIGPFGRPVSGPFVLSLTTRQPRARRVPSTPNLRALPRRCAARPRDAEMRAPASRETKLSPAPHRGACLGRRVATQVLGTASCRNRQSPACAQPRGALLPWTKSSGRAVGTLHCSFEAEAGAGPAVVAFLGWTRPESADRSRADSCSCLGMRESSAPPACRTAARPNEASREPVPRRSLVGLKRERVGCLGRSGRPEPEEALGGLPSGATAALLRSRPRARDAERTRPRGPLWRPSGASGPSLELSG